MKSPPRVPLLAALLLLLGAALAVALVPTGLGLDRRIASELRRVAVDDLGRAPMILEDRNAARAEALSMHAMTVAGVEGIAEAVATGRIDEARAMATDAAAMYGEEPVLVDAAGATLVGPRVPETTVNALRSGATPVVFVFEGGLPRTLALVPLRLEGAWVGAAGSSSPLDASLATTLSALARSDVTVLGADGSVVASTLLGDSASVLAGALRAGGGRPESEKVAEFSVDGDAVWVASAPLADAGSVVFSRPVAHELAALPGVRRGALLAGLITLILALAVGLLVAANLTRPVAGLAEAAERISHGDFDAPVPGSRVSELDRLAASFRSMRASLQDRLIELGEANRALGERQDKLRELQAELIRRDRLASSARMAAELAHEIRNPVANVRNCLEVVRRSLPDGSDASRFADMAIDELLRMHELAEHLLDLNRPAAAGAGWCDPGEVGRQVATLSGVGDSAADVSVLAPGDPVEAAIPPDALKQILFVLVENAREAAGADAPIRLTVTDEGDSVRITVDDRGPGISDAVAAHLFDPFFTTKEAVSGVGLGLFVAEGLARRYGGRMEARNREDGPGASFLVELPRGRGAGVGVGERVEAVVDGRVVAGVDDELATGVDGQTEADST